MGGGNGAKAAQRRERNQKDAQKSNKGSQLKANAQALEIQCEVCKSTFLKTSRAPALTDHAVNKHSKTLAECFPKFVPQEGNASKKK